MQEIEKLGSTVQPEPEKRDMGAEELSQSFSAFKKRLEQGRELKYLKKDLEQHQDALKAMRATYADNCDILENFSQIVGALYDVVEGNAKIIASTQATIGRIDASVEELEQRLKQAEQEHAQALVPESEALYAANSDLASAQASVKACKGAVSDARKAAKAEGAGAAEQSAHAEAQRALEAAEARHDQMREAQKSAQRAYDAKAGAFKKAEKGMKDEISRMQKDRRQHEKDIAELEKKSNEAKARLDRCEHVKQNPHETEELAAQIEAAVEEERQMGEAIVALGNAHETSKKSSTLARNIVAVLIGCAVLVVVGGFLIQLFT